MADQRRLEVPEAVVRMDRVVTCLALELPGSVWDDVAEKWQAVRDLFTVEES